MRRIWSLALHDFSLLLAEPGSFVAKLLLPVAFIAVVGIANDAFQTGEPGLPILELVDEDRSELSVFFLRLVRDGAAGVTIRGDGGEPAVTGESDIVVLVPAGFARLLESGEDARVRLVFARGDPEQASHFVPLLESAARRTSMVLEAGDGATALANAPHGEQAASNAVTRALETLGEERITVSRETVELSGRYPLEGFRQSVPGMGSMFVMLNVLAGAATLVEERRRWTLQRTLVAPVSRGAFVAGKISGRFLVGMMQFLVAIVTGLVIGAIVGIDFGTSPLLMAVVMAAFVLAVSAVSVMLATLVTREQQASGLTTLLAVSLAPLGGAWWSLDIEIVPDVMRRVAVISPFYWVMEGFRAAIHDLGIMAAAVPVGVLLGVAMIAGAIAVIRTR